jgi:hypothetical protein
MKRLSFMRTGRAGHCCAVCSRFSPRLHPFPLAALAKALDLKPQ